MMSMGVYNHIIGFIKFYKNLKLYNTTLKKIRSSLFFSLNNLHFKIRLLENKFQS